VNQRRDLAGAGGHALYFAAKAFWSERTEVPVPRYWFFFPVWSPSSA